MGVLDDAIREHLDLKRRHGASEEEIKRNEQEALGRRGVGAPEPSDASEAAEPFEPGQPTIGAVPSTQNGGLEAPPDEATALLEPEEIEPSGAAPAPMEPAPDAEATPDEVLPEEALEAEPPAAPPSPSRAVDAGQAEPREEALPAEEVAGEDVLEDVPDFLEESPDQDRLWFEQKPPKDFEFD
jgi:hypothetical protein